MLTKQDCIVAFLVVDSILWKGGTAGSTGIVTGLKDRCVAVSLVLCKAAYRRDGTIEDDKFIGSRVMNNNPAENPIRTGLLSWREAVRKRQRQKSCQLDIILTTQVFF